MARGAQQGQSRALRRNGGEVQTPSTEKKGGRHSAGAAAQGGPEQPVWRMGRHCEAQAPPLTRPRPTPRRQPTLSCGGLHGTHSRLPMARQRAPSRQGLRLDLGLRFRSRPLPFGNSAFSTPHHATPHHTTPHHTTPHHTTPHHTTPHHTTPHHTTPHHTTPHHTTPYHTTPHHTTPHHTTPHHTIPHPNAPLVPLAHVGQGLGVAVRREVTGSPPASSSVRRWGSPR